MRTSSGAPMLLGLPRFKTTASGSGWRSLKDYVRLPPGEPDAIYYATGTDLARLEASPQLEGFRARGIEVLLLPDAVDSFWVTAGVDYEASRSSPSLRAARIWRSSRWLMPRTMRTRRQQRRSRASFKP